MDLLSLHDVTRKQDSEPWLLYPRREGPVYLLSLCGVSRLGWQFPEVEVVGDGDGQDLGDASSTIEGSSSFFASFSTAPESNVVTFPP